VSLLWIASLLISLATGALLAALLLPIRKRGGGEIALTLFAGGGIGIGVSSCVHFLCLTAGVAAFAWAADLALFLLLSFLCIRRFRKELLGVPLSLLPKQPFSGFQILLASLLTVEIVASTASFLVAYLKEPHGKWDACPVPLPGRRGLARGLRERTGLEPLGLPPAAAVGDRPGLALRRG